MNEFNPNNPEPGRAQTSEELELLRKHREQMAAADEVLKAKEAAGSGTESRDIGKFSESPQEIASRSAVPMAEYLEAKAIHREAQMDLPVSITDPEQQKIHLARLIESGKKAKPNELGDLGNALTEELQRNIG